MLCAYFRSDRLGGLDDPSLPAAYRATRMARADFVVESIRARGGQAIAVEADLSDAGVRSRRSSTRRSAQLGPVQILVNNASGWVGDTFAPQATDRFGRSQNAVTARTIDQVIAVDARAAALLIAEFARRHVARRGQWGRIVGLTSGEADGFPEEVSYGAAKAAQVSFTLSAASELARYGVTANVVHPPITDTGWINPQTAAARTVGRPAGGHAEGSGRGDRLLGLRRRRARSRATSSGCVDPRRLRRSGRSAIRAREPCPTRRSP